jgi:hypothetical protein
MHRITRRSVLILVVIGALVAGGAAYTNSITGAGTSNNTAGYKDVTVTGAVLTDATYGLSADGSQIDTVKFVFAGDLTNDNLEYLIDTSAAPQNGTGHALAACISPDVTAGVIQASAVSGTGPFVTTVTCTPAAPLTTSTATDLDIAVTNS